MFWDISLTDGSDHEAEIPDPMVGVLTEADLPDVSAVLAKSSAVPFNKSYRDVLTACDEEMTDNSDPNESSVNTDSEGDCRTKCDSAASSLAVPFWPQPSKHLDSSAEVLASLARELFLEQAILAAPSLREKIALLQTYFRNVWQYYDDLEAQFYAEVPKMTSHRDFEGLGTDSVAKSLLNRLVGFLEVTTEKLQQEIFWFWTHVFTSFGIKQTYANFLHRKPMHMIVLTQQLSNEEWRVLFGITKVFTQLKTRCDKLSTDYLPREIAKNLNYTKNTTVISCFFDVAMVESILRNKIDDLWQDPKVNFTISSIKIFNKLRVMLVALQQDACLTYQQVPYLCSSSTSPFCGNIRSCPSERDRLLSKMLTNFDKRVIKALLICVARLQDFLDLEEEDLVALLDQVIVWIPPISSRCGLQCTIAQRNYPVVDWFRMLAVSLGVKVPLHKKS